jgi:hypothetical protein
MALFQEQPGSGEAFGTQEATFKEKGIGAVDRTLSW